MDGLHAELGRTTFPVAAHALAVLESAAVGRRYHRLVVAAPGVGERVQPGQFFHLLWRQAGAARRAHICVARWACGGRRAGRLGFLFDVTGRGAAALARLRGGNALSAVGPLGRGFALRTGCRRILVRARGVGLETLAPLAVAAARQGVAVEAILSARAPANLMAAEFVGVSGAVVHAVFEADGSSAPERVGTPLRARFSRARPDAVFTCGSNLLLLLLRLAGQFGILGEVALEQQMGCALGICFCCVQSIRHAFGVHNERVCTEGPVFDLQAALSW